MSQVDDRIVKLGFDNKDFEKNVEKTQKSLKKLDDSLKLEDAASKCESSCDTINNALSGLNVEAINKFVDKSISRFNVWGKTIQNIVDSVANTAFGELSNLFTSVPSIIVSAGRNRAQNIENARFQLKGLGMDVEQIMDDANYAVSGTAYGLDQAAKAAAQFGASGIQAGEEMKTTLRGVSGVAAMTNSDFTEIARIFTAVAGLGKVQTIRIQQLSDRGLRVTGKLAEAYGVTEEKMTEMISKGQVDAKSFFKVMDAAFGEHATKANETYAGALGNVRAALGRVGEKFESKKMESFRRIFVSMIPVINGFKNELMPFIDGWNSIVETVTSRISGLFDKVKSYQEAMKDSETILTKISKIVLGLAEDFNKLLSAVGKGVKDGINPSLSSFDSIINRISVAFDKIRPSLDTLTTISQIVARVTYTIKNLLTVVGQVFGALYDAITGGSGTGLLEVINGVAGAVAYLSKNLVLSENGLESLRKIFGGIASAGRIVLKIINPIANAISAFIQALAGTKVNNATDGILGLLAVVGELVTKFEKFLEETGILSALSYGLSSAGKILGSALGGLLSILSKLLGGAGGKLSDWISKLTANGGLSGAITNIFNSLLNKLSSFGTRFVAVLSLILTKAKAVINNIYTWLKRNIFSKISSDVKNTGDSVNDTIEKSTSVWDKLFNTIKIGIIGIGTALAGTLGTVLGSVITIVNRVTKPLKGFGDVLNGVGDLMTGFSKKITGDTFVSKASAIGDAAIKLAKGFGILAAAMAALSLINTDALKGVSSALVPLILTITLFAGVIGTLVTKNKLANTIKTFGRSLTGLTNTISSAIDNLSSVNVKKPASITDVIKSLINGLLKIAISAFIIANIYKKNKSGFIAAMAAIGGFMVLFTVAAKVLSSSGKKMSSMNNTDKIMNALSKMLIKLSLSIRILMVSLRGFGADQWSVVLTGLLGGMTAIGGLMALATLMVKILSNIKIDDAQLKTIQKLGKVMSSMALAMIPVAFAIKMIVKSGADDGGIKAAASIALVITAIGGLILIAKSIKPESEKIIKLLSKIILSVGIMALLMGKAIKSFANIQTGQAIGFFGSMVLVLGSVFAMLIIAKKVSSSADESDRFVKSMTGITVMIGVIGLALAAIAMSMKPLANYDWTRLLPLLGIIATFMAGLTAILHMVTKMENISTGQILAIALAITALGAGLTAMGIGMGEFVKPFAELNATQAISAVVAIIGMMVMLAVLINVASKIGEEGAAILAIVAVFAYAIGLAVRNVGQGIKDSLAPIQQFLDLIGYVMEAIDKLIWAVQNMDMIVTAAQTLKDNFNLIATAISDALTLTFDDTIGGIFDKLKQRIPELKELIPIIKETLSTVQEDVQIIILQIGQILGTAIGAVIGALGSSVWTGIVTSIETIALSIAQNASKFADTIGLALEAIIYAVANFMRTNAIKLATALRIAFKEIVESLLKMIFNDIIGGAKTLLGWLSSALAKLGIGGDDGPNLLNKWIEKLASVENKVYDSTNETESQAFGPAWDDFQNRLNEATSGGKSLLERIGDVFSGGENGDKSWADKLEEAVGTAKSSILGGLFGDEAKDQPVGDTLKQWLEENGLSNLFGEGDANSLFGAENGSDTTTSSMLSALNGINANTLATAGNTASIKENTEDMTVTLDSGQVVGALAPDMYDALGRIRTQKGRGN